MSRVRLVPIIFFAVICLSILFGGWQAYQRFGIVQPLTSDLRKIDGVQSVEIDTGNPTIVDVRLKQIPDLQTTYLQISGVVGRVLGGSSLLSIEDSRNATLTSAWETTIGPLVYEGAAKANFREMIHAVETAAAQLGIDARITMDDHNVYTQLWLPNNKYYLYNVYPVRQGGASS